MVVYTDGLPSMANLMVVLERDPELMALEEYRILHEKEIKKMKIKRRFSKRETPPPHPQFSQHLIPVGFVGDVESC